MDGWKRIHRWKADCGRMGQGPHSLDEGERETTTFHLPESEVICISTFLCQHILP